MAAIMEYKLDADAGNILWISDEGDVILEIGGVWKSGRDLGKDDLLEDPKLRLYVNRDVTRTEIGLAVLLHWKEQGCPTKNIHRRPTKAYCAEMACAPEFVRMLFSELDESLAAGMPHSIERTGIPTLMPRVSTSQRSAR